MTNAVAVLLAWAGVFSFVWGAAGSVRVAAAGSGLLLAVLALAGLYEFDDGNRP